MGKTDAEKGENMDKHLQEMGQVIEAELSQFSIQEDGSVVGPFGKFVPVGAAEEIDLSWLRKAIRLTGSDPAAFKFQQYHVIVGNPYHGGKVDLRFPDQIAVKGPYYQGLHQADLLERSPFVAAVEFKTYGRKPE